MNSTKSGTRTCSPTQKLVGDPVSLPPSPTCGLCLWPHPTSLPTLHRLFLSLLQPPHFTPTWFSRGQGMFLPSFSPSPGYLFGGSSFSPYSPPLSLTHGLVQGCRPSWDVSHGRSTLIPHWEHRQPEWKVPSLLLWGITCPCPWLPGSHWRSTGLSGGGLSIC